MCHIPVLARPVPLAFSLATADIGHVTEALAHGAQQLLSWHGGCMCVYMLFPKFESNGKNFSTT